MSRVIVRGLPIYLTEDKLKAHFAKQGPVTDVKLMKKRNGESRRFAFIGYRSDEDASTAVKYFDSSYIDTARIEVEIAKTFSDPLVPQSWRDKKRSAEDRLKETEEKLQKLEEYQQQKSLKKQRKENKIANVLDSKIESNPKLREYMDTLKPTNQSRKYGEDNGPTNKDLEQALLERDGGDQSTLDTKNKRPEVAVIKSTASDDEYDEFSKGADEGFGGFSDKEDEGEEKMISLNDFGHDSIHINTQPETELDDEQKIPENMSDLDWFKMRRTRMKEGESDEVPKTSEKPVEQKEQLEEEREQQQQQAVEADDEDEAMEEPEPELTAEDKAIQQISQTGRLFLRNILYTAKEHDFQTLFGKYGELEEVHIAIDTRTGQSKGFAYIKFVNPRDAVNAYLNLDKQIFQGRLLHILPGQEKKDHKLDEFDLANLPLKKQRELKRKHDASKQQFSWNSLFMSNDAILESVASGLGISKGELINPESSNSAVKQALAEAHVIGNVRQYFEGKGVDLTTFNNKAEKDDRIILIKNFQHGTTQEELGELFAVHGELKRILMPPSGTIAIVEFRDAPSGRNAFNKLAFRRLGKSILYLEKGPKDLFITDDVKPTELLTDINSNKTSVQGKEAKASSTDLLDVTKDTEEAEEEDNKSVSGPTVSIFVKNLNFITTSKDLTEAFKPLEGFMVGTVKTKPDTKNPGKTLSMGFGFVEFKTKEQANAAISTMDGHLLDGHKIQLKISNRVSQPSSSSSTSSKKKSKRSPKIIIKNLPFESTRKDVFELFGSFGTLKSVRVPKKFNKSARGFAFVEFSSLKEAESAMDQLQGVHLLGRRLVLDYAELESDNTEDEISKMISKAKTQTNTRKMADLRESYAGKRKLELDDDESNEFDLNK